MSGIQEIELAARCNGNAIGEAAMQPPEESLFNPTFVDFQDPARLYPVNVTVQVPDGPNEVWVYRVAAHSVQEAKDKLIAVFDGAELNVLRVLVLPALPGDYEFLMARTVQ
jgi:hypothetical protein